MLDRHCRLVGSFRLFLPGVFAGEFGDAPEDLRNVALYFAVEFVT